MHVTEEREFIEVLKDANRKLGDHARAQQQEIDQLKAALDATSTAEETKEAAGHRLALELECLLLDCKDNVVVSRWMDTACEALEDWRKLFPYNGPRLGD